MSLEISQVNWIVTELDNTLGNHTYTHQKKQNQIKDAAKKLTEMTFLD